MSKPRGLSKCPVSGCPESPGPIFCGTHWPKVSGDVRRELVKTFKGLRGSGLRNPPAKLLELLTIGVREATR